MESIKTGKKAKRLPIINNLVAKESVDSKEKKRSGAYFALAE